MVFANLVQLTVAVFRLLCSVVDNLTLIGYIQKRLKSVIVVVIIYDSNCTALNGRSQAIKFILNLNFSTVLHNALCRPAILLINELYHIHSFGLADCTMQLCMRDRFMHVIGHQI